MLKADIIEEHPINEPAPWISNSVVAPKPDQPIRVTLDARNVNKYIQSNNHPIPRPEDIKATLAGATIFSKMDFKSAFFQLELHPESRYLTVFHGDGKLYRYKRLTMGMKPSQGELNTALAPIFAHIPQAHLIHDDVVLATKTKQEHEIVLEQTLKAIEQSGLTLNPDKCEFGKSEIKFWGMLITAEGVKPDPGKVAALDHLQVPTNKSELNSFLCMMQSNGEFIPNFARLTAPLRELLKKNKIFKWTKCHNDCFNLLLQSFRETTLLRYFDMNKKTFIFTDAHITGLGATLAQGDSIDTALPIAFASRTTNDAEKRYCQLDLECMALDFGLRRFRAYVLGSPQEITVVVDHKPLESVFNGSRIGSIRTERVKMRHQDVRLKVAYRKGIDNPSDYISRNGKPWKEIPIEQQKESEDLMNLVFMLHMTPIVDAIGMKEIAAETLKDEKLQKLSKIISNIMSPEEKLALLKIELAPFKQILHELTVMANGLIFKGDRIVLPESLQNKALKLAHLGAHPGQGGLERRLRSHFYFPGLDNLVRQLVERCHDCQIFSRKFTKEPITPNRVPSANWEEVSVDLFGPMPSRNHVVIVQDLASRFPCGKVVPSTSAREVLPAMAEIYNAYGNPNIQKSDNGPPFNSAEMESFANKRGVELVKTPPAHPAPNNVETFMKPLGKAMKAGAENKRSESSVLNELLQSYRDTPHPATGVSPGALLFRDGYQTNFPRMHITEEQASEARRKDKDAKLLRQENINSSKYYTSSKIKIGDNVLVRNYQRERKFDPYFLPEPFIVTNVVGSKITVQRSSDGRELIRHPDDIKVYKGEYKPMVMKGISTEKDAEISHMWNSMFEGINDIEEADEQWNEFVPIENEIANENLGVSNRTIRNRHPNPRYFNENTINRTEYIIERR